MRRSPYLRDRLADMPVFRDRDRPLPMSPEARCSKATAESIPPPPLRDPPVITWLSLCSSGMINVFFDDSIPEGTIEIDGTRITLDEMRVACEGP